MSIEDYMISKNLAKRFCDITDMMLCEIRDGSICGNDMNRYTEQIVAICDAISTIYKVKGGFDNV